MPQPRHRRFIWTRRCNWPAPSMRLCTLPSWCSPLTRLRHKATPFPSAFDSPKGRRRFGWTCLSLLARLQNCYHWTQTASLTRYILLPLKLPRRQNNCLSHWARSNGATRCSNLPSRRSSELKIPLRVNGRSNDGACGNQDHGL